MTQPDTRLKPSDHYRPDPDAINRPPDHGDNDTLLPKNRGSIRRKLMTTLVGLIVVLVITHTSIELLLQKQSLSSELNKRISLMHSNLVERSHTLANVLLPQVENDMAAFNFSRIAEVLSKAIEESDLLEYAILMNSDAVVFSSSQQPDSYRQLMPADADSFALAQTQAVTQEYPQINTIERILPIRLGIKQWGVLRLGFTTAELEKEIASSNDDIMHQTGKMILTSVIIALIFIAIASAIVLLIANKLSRPLVQLTLLAKQLAQGNFDSLEAVTSKGVNTKKMVLNADGEIGQLGHSFIEMASQIRQSQQKLEDYNRTLEDKVQARTQELEQANLKLQELDQLKTNFLSTVSHELRTPLTSVLGFARIIQKKFETDLIPILQNSSDKKVDRAVRQIVSNTAIIVEEGQRLTTLINDVLDLAKMEAGRIDWNIKPIAIDEVIERAMTATTALFENKDVALRKQLCTSAPEIQADRDRLIQVVINLISNAIKFTQHGAVTLRTQLTDQALIVSVSDSGCGIRAEDQALVFEKFKQVGDTLTDKPKGTGLGLPICKEIIEHHGGKIWVDSTPGVGSTFSFSLPLMPANTQTLIANDNHAIAFVHHLSQTILEQRLQALPAAHQHSSSRDKQILVVDDDPNIRQLLLQELGNEGYQVSGVESGLEALALMQTQTPDLLVLDVCMPNLNGFAVAAELRANPCTLSLPIVMHTVAEDKKLGEMLSIDRYLTKPVANKVLIDAIKDLLRSHADRTSKHIVLCDPDAGRRQRLTELLSVTAHQLHQASDIDSCLRYCQQYPVNLIIAPALPDIESRVIAQINTPANTIHSLFLLLD